MSIQDQIADFCDMQREQGKPVPTTVLLGPVIWKQYAEWAASKHGPGVLYGGLSVFNDVSIILAPAIENWAMRFLVDIPNR